MEGQPGQVLIRREIHHYNDFIVGGIVIFQAGNIGGIGDVLPLPAIRCLQPHPHRRVHSAGEPVNGLFLIQHR